MQFLTEPHLQELAYFYNINVLKWMAREGIRIPNELFCKMLFYSGYFSGKIDPVFCVVAR